MYLHVRLPSCFQCISMFVCMSKDNRNRNRTATGTFYVAAFPATYLLQPLFIAGSQLTHMSIFFLNKCTNVHTLTCSRLLFLQLLLLLLFLLLLLLLRKANVIGSLLLMLLQFFTKSKTNVYRKKWGSFVVFNKPSAFLNLFYTLSS